MSVSPALMFSPSTDSPAEPGKVRAETPVPGSGAVSGGEIYATQPAPGVALSPQDEVKVQIEPPGETPVYQFVNQNGSLILQVPSEQMLNLAREITQELAQEVAPKVALGGEGGKDNGR